MTDTDSGSTVKTTSVALSSKYCVRLVEYAYDMGDYLWWELVNWRSADVVAEGPAYTKDDALELALKAAVSAALES